MACGYGNFLTLGCCTSWFKVGQATCQNTDVGMLLCFFELFNPECHLWDRGCCLIGPIVVCKLHHWKVVVPVILMLIDPEAKILFQPLIGLLWLSIHSWVICCGVVLGHSSTFAQSLDKLWCEFMVSVTYEFLWQPEPWEYMLYEESGCFFCHHGFFAWNKEQSWSVTVSIESYPWTISLWSY